MKFLKPIMTPYMFRKIRERNMVMLDIDDPELQELFSLARLESIYGQAHFQKTLRRFRWQVYGWGVYNFILVMFYMTTAILGYPLSTWDVISVSLCLVLFILNVYIGLKTLILSYTLCYGSPNMHHLNYDKFFSKLNMKIVKEVIRLSIHRDFKKYKVGETVYYNNYKKQFVEGKIIAYNKKKNTYTIDNGDNISSLTLLEYPAAHGLL